MDTKEKSSNFWKYFFQSNNKLIIDLQEKQVDYVVLP